METSLSAEVKNPVKRPGLMMVLRRNLLRGRHAVYCMKQYVEAMLLEGRVLRCPHYQCESKPTLRSFASLLTPKLKKMWEQMIQDDSIPVLDRVYCPNPMCLALMSVSELSKSTNGHMRCCFKCSKPFCINCKVPWHNNMSCGDYKRLGPNPTTNDMMLKTLANQKMGAFMQFAGINIIPAPHSLAII
ncbi:hypothetical protein YC2023_119575 [Brassica napus]